MNRRQMSSFYPLALAVRRLFHKLSHSVAALHHDSDVSVGMRAVLESIIDEGPQTVPQLARVRPVTRQHIQTLVNALLKGSYVEYIDNPAHKRSKLVSPTDHGRATFETMRALENEAFQRLSLSSSHAELETATAVLQSLIEALEAPDWQLRLRRHTTEAESKQAG